MKNLFVTGSLLAALGVMLGAFGAHSLKASLEPEQLQIFETGVKYQMYHSLALIILSIAGNQYYTSSLRISARFFLAGIILFSGSLYLLSCCQLLGIESWKSVLGPLTPLGGLCFICGWIGLTIYSLKYPFKK